MPVSKTPPQISAHFPATVPSTRPTITPAVSDWKGVTAGGGWNQAGTEADGGPKQVDVHEIWERYPEEVWLYERADGTPQEFAALIASESEKWSRVVREAKIKPE